MPFHVNANSAIIICISPCENPSFNPEQRHDGVLGIFADALSSGDDGKSCILNYSRETQHRSDNYCGWFREHMCWRPSTTHSDVVDLSSASHRHASDYDMLIIIKFRTHSEYLKTKLGHCFFYLSGVAAEKASKCDYNVKACSDISIAREWLIRNVWTPNIHQVRFLHNRTTSPRQYIKDMNEYLNNSFCFKY